MVALHRLEPYIDVLRWNPACLACASANFLGALLLNRVVDALLAAELQWKRCEMQGPMLRMFPFGRTKPCYHAAVLLSLWQHFSRFLSKRLHKIP